MDTKAIVSKARSEIIWGASETQVREMLVRAGCALHEVDQIVETLLEERFEEIRKRGKREIALGLGLTVMSAIGMWIIVGDLSLDSSAGSGWVVIVGRAQAMILALLLFGLGAGFTKLVDGLLDVFRPQAKSGSLS